MQCFLVARERSKLSRGRIRRVTLSSPFIILASCKYVNWSILSSRALGDASVYKFIIRKLRRVLLLIMYLWQGSFQSSCLGWSFQRACILGSSRGDGLCRCGLVCVGVPCALTGWAVERYSRTRSLRSTSWRYRRARRRQRSGRCLCSLPSSTLRRTRCGCPIPWGCFPSQAYARAGTGIRRLPVRRSCIWRSFARAWLLPSQGWRSCIAIGGRGLGRRCPATLRTSSRRGFLRRCRPRCLNLF